MNETDFPLYTEAERKLDGMVHLVGTTAAPVAVVWLLVRAGLEGGAGPIVALAIYGVGLLAMIGASAAYNLVSPGPLKARLRRLDHAMIFVMIAGSYTPFAVKALAAPLGTALIATVWLLAVCGMMLKLRAPGRLERLSLLLYLGMGWLVLLVIGPLSRAMPLPALVLLVSGGLVYSLGTLVHTRSWPFQNALWHAMVLLAAMLHFFAIAKTFALL